VSNETKENETERMLNDPCGLGSSVNIVAMLRAGRPWFDSQ